MGYLKKPVEEVPLWIKVVCSCVAILIAFILSTLVQAAMWHP